MPDLPDPYTIRHFSQGNPAGPTQDDVPALLRRLADTIEDLGPVWIQDIVLHNEITAEGDYYSFTVYYHEESD
ncbi:MULTISPECIES: hypothetical protein [unclassified Micromonospora]|uniref:hypothetical protein n=1 Tax=unclassified Micromonospora TaxID=2617518 RepID=UPI00104922CD|nr:MULTISPECIES: hypothetical protein [unclassified Micromonospora]TDB69905.1 hypothetical protein E1182_28615 [Micromonospora sp. KC721]TDB69976.1 hypothetical protein E1165_27090 [Micromonospora sp. KC723]TDC40510.1 hypothetical protein E1166_14610 [Micromonospora sp. KC213]